eukprot:5955143-Prymnesium_polylepis.1
MIVARERIRDDPAVQAAISQLWFVMLRLSGREKEGRMYKNDYAVMSRKLYLVVKLQAAERDFDPDDCCESLEDDWDEDAAGK